MTPGRRLRRYWRVGASRPSTPRGFLRSKITDRGDLERLLWFVVGMGCVAVVAQGVVRSIKWRTLPSRTWWKFGVVAVLVVGTALSIFVLETVGTDFRQGLDDLVDFWLLLARSTDAMRQATESIDAACSTDVEEVLAATAALKKDFDDSRRPLERYKSKTTRFMALVKKPINVWLIQVPWFIFLVTLAILVISPIVRKTRRRRDTMPSERETHCKVRVLQVTAAWTFLWLPVLVLLLGGRLVLAVYAADFCFIGAPDILREEDSRNEATVWYLRPAGEENPLAEDVATCSIAVDALVSVVDSCDDVDDHVDVLVTEMSKIETATLTDEYTDLAKGVFDDDLCRDTVDELYASYVLVAVLGVAVVLFLLMLPCIYRSLADDTTTSRRHIKAVIGDESFVRRSSSHSSLGGRNRCCCAATPPINVEDSDDETNDPAATRWHPDDEFKEAHDDDIAKPTNLPTTLPAFTFDAASEDDDDDWPSSEDDDDQRQWLSSAHATSPKHASSSGTLLLPIVTSRSSRMSLPSIAEEDGDDDDDGTVSSGEHGRRGFAHFFRSFSQGDDDDVDDDTFPVDGSLDPIDTGSTISRYSSIEV